MTTSEVCGLIVSLDIKPWCSESREYEVMRRSLSSLDEYTLKFQDQYQFYESVKAELMPRVNKDSISEVGLVPIEVTLSKNGVFIRSKVKDKRALFQNIELSSGVYSLDNLVLSGMVKGGLKALYECDKKRSGTHYQSFFIDKLKYAGERLEVDAVKESDYVYVLNELKTHKRYSEVARFLLGFLQPETREESFDTIYESYLSDVSETDYNELNYRDDNTEVKGYYYRYPYKED